MGKINLIQIALMAVLMLSLFQVAFSQETPAEAKPLPKPAEPVIKVTLSSPQTEVMVGEMIKLDLTLTNMTDNKLTVIKPIIDVDSVTFSITYAPYLENENGWSFVFSGITPSVYEHSRDKMNMITLGKKGTPEAAYKASFTLPAVVPTTCSIAADYHGASESLSSNSVAIKISSPKTTKGEDLKQGELIAVMETSMGKMSFRFFLHEAPNTVMHFLKLSKEGFYNNLTFHRIIKDFMIQGGDPDGRGSGGPGYSIGAELNNNKHQKGTLSMARSSHLDSAGSQFFVCLAPQQRLDSGYTTFGQLIEGVEILDAIGKVKTTGSNANPADRPLQPVTIKNIILEYRLDK